MNTTVFPNRRTTIQKHYQVNIIHAAPEQEANEKYTEKSKSSSPQHQDAPQKKSATSEKGDKIKKDLDKIMDEIDEVLEENAEEFIKSYVQRGGE